MRKLVLALALSVAGLSVPLAGCASVTSPASVSDRTKLDEQAAISVNAAYKAFRISVEVAVESGLVKPGSPVAIKIADADNVAYQAVLAVDAAYRAGNSADYANAVARANQAISIAVGILSDREALKSAPLDRR